MIAHIIEVISRPDRYKVSSVLLLTFFDLKILGFHDETMIFSYHFFAFSFNKRINPIKRRYFGEYVYNWECAGCVAGR
jgi:hypothetical protein